MRSNTNNWTSDSNDLGVTNNLNSLSKQQTQSGSSLKPLKETNKFSSWTDQNLFDQVDELLSDGENNNKSLTQKQSKPQSQTINFQKNLNQSKTSGQKSLSSSINSHKESLLSLSGSLLDLDGYDIEDEVTQNANRGNQQVFQYQMKNSHNEIELEESGELISDSLDLDNSDDLNKVISRYEAMLGATSNNNEQKVKNQQIRKSENSLQSSLEESWGTHELKKSIENNNSKAISKKSADYDEYEADDFEQHEDEFLEDDDNEKLVDDEINLNSNVGNKDSDFLNELMNQPLRTKQSQQLQRQQNQSQQEQSDTKTNLSALSKNIDSTSNDDSSGEYSDDIDEFIKRHIENEEVERKAQEAKFNQSSVLNSQSTSNSNNCSSNSNSSGSDSDEISHEDDKRTPHQVLVDEIKKLTDVYSKYSLNDREMFLSDFDNILKVLSYQETVELVIPVLEVFSNEQEFLKLQFFQKIPTLFVKLYSIPEKKQETLDTFTFQLFPLISKMLVNSEEQVQVEGVEALLKISKDSFNQQDTQQLILSLVEMMMLKADQTEGAKIVVMMIVEKFAENDIFKEIEGMKFINEYLPIIQKGMLFKIKKFLLPTLLALSRHITYENFEKHVYQIFIKFSQDDIWGVRKVCLEKLQDFIKLIKHCEVQKLIQASKFLQTSLLDSSRWVKNQAFAQFGYIIHEVYQKVQLMDNKNDQQTLKLLISSCFETFYDQKVLSQGDDDSMICQSFMGNQNDDIDKIKYNWSFFISCSLLINGGQDYWESTIKCIYQKLYKDILINVRKSLASSLVEVLKFVDMTSQENQSFFLEVMTHYLSDIDDVKQKVIPQICIFVSLYPKEQHNSLLSTLIREQLDSDSCQKRESKIQLLEQIYSLFDSKFLAEQEFQLNLINVIEANPAISYKKRACKLFGQKVIAPLIKTKKYRKPLTSFLDNLRLSKNFRQRQLYLIIARSTYKADNDIFKKHFAKAIGTDLVSEQVKVVQIKIAKLCSKIPDGYSKSIDKVRSKLISIQRPDILQYLNKQEYIRQSQLLYTEEEEPVKSLEESQQTEKDQQEAIEKSVTIRFANFSSLIRASSGSSSDITSMFNSQLMGLLAGFLNPSSMLGKNSGDID